MNLRNRKIKPTENHLPQVKKTTNQKKNKKKKKASSSNEENVPESSVPQDVIDVLLERFFINDPPSHEESDNEGCSRKRKRKTIQGKNKAINKDNEAAPVAIARNSRRQEDGVVVYNEQEPREMDPEQNQIHPIQQNLDRDDREVRAHDIGHPPTNPADRRRLVLLPPPHDKEFSDQFAAKVIGHNCLDGWPTPVIKWKDVPDEFRDCAWEDFTKRFTWDTSIDSNIKEMYRVKCYSRTKGNMNKAHKRALKEAEKLHPGQGEEFMHLFHPWFATSEIWTQMCQEWRKEDFKKKSKVAKANRSGGQPSGVRAKGTYKGGTKSQVHYMREQESRTEGESETPMNWAEMYVSLRSNLPGVAEGAEEYQRMMHEKHPEATNILPFDEEVWMKATGSKKGYVKGIGQKRTRPSSFSECTSASSSAGHFTTTLAAPTSQQQAQEIIQAICQDPRLMEQLKATFFSCLQPHEIQAALANAHGQSSHASGNNGPHESPPPPPPPPQQ